MEMRIRIKAGQLEVVAELNDTDTAQAIWEALPIKGRGVVGSAAGNSD